MLLLASTRRFEMFRAEEMPPSDFLPFFFLIKNDVLLAFGSLVNPELQLKAGLAALHLFSGLVRSLYTQTS